MALSSLWVQSGRAKTIHDARQVPLRGLLLGLSANSKWTGKSSPKVDTSHHFAAAVRVGRLPSAGQDVRKEGGSRKMLCRTDKSAGGALEPPSTLLRGAWKWRRPEQSYGTSLRLS